MPSLLPNQSHVGRLAECIGALQAATCPVVMSVGEALDSDWPAWRMRATSDKPARRMRATMEDGNREARDPVGRSRVLPEWRQAPAAVVLPGSFNPLHMAHVTLLGEASRLLPQKPGSLPPVAALSLSVRTINKARATGMLLPDRAWTMHATLSAMRSPECAHHVALLASHGLYLDQAIALRNAMPGLHADGLWFAIGHDKACQIFDARYYDDRDAALQALFRLAGLLVAPRAGGTAADVQELMDLPENRRFAPRVRPISLPSCLADVSSTAYRAGVPTQGKPELPAPVVAMIEARRCYD